MLDVGAGSRALSSRDMRFSAVKLPCERGEGRAGRGMEVGIDKVFGVDDAVAEVVVVVDEGGGGDMPGRVVDPDDDVEEFR